MSGNRPDFVFVRLTKHGEKIAGGAPIVICGARNQFTFTPGEKKEVTRAFDWGVVLSHERMEGEPLFELVPEDELPSDDEREHPAVKELKDEIF